jgi:hypothetical protein
MIYETKFLLSLLLTVSIEVPILILIEKYVLRTKRIKVFELLYVGFFASALTLPYLWFILPPYIDSRHYLIIGEVLVSLCEAMIYFKFLSFSVKKALLMSTLLNAASYTGGLVLFRFIF